MSLSREEVWYGAYLETFKSVLAAATSGNKNVEDQPTLERIVLDNADFALAEFDKRFGDEEKREGMEFERGAPTTGVITFKKSDQLQMRGAESEEWLRVRAKDVSVGMTCRICDNSLRPFVINNVISTLDDVVTFHVENLTA